MDTEKLYRQILIDHYNNPQNKVSFPPEGYEVRKGINPSCGDELELYINFEKNQIVDIKFNGEGCSICCSSVSILTNEIQGLTKEEIIIKTENFERLIKGKEFNEDLFEDAIAYIGLAKFPARYKCAFLSWQTVKDFFDVKEGDTNE